MILTSVQLKYLLLMVASIFVGTGVFAVFFGGTIGPFGWFFVGLITIGLCGSVAGSFIRHRDYIKDDRTFHVWLRRELNGEDWPVDE